MVSAPPLCVFLPPESAPEVAGAQEPIRQEGAKAGIGASKLLSRERFEYESPSGSDQGECVAQAGGGGVEEAMAGACEPAPVGALPSARGGRGQRVSREAEMAALLFARHSTMAPRFSGGPRFLRKHSLLWSSSLLSPQAVSSRPTAVPSPGLLPDLMLQPPAPMCTGRRPSQAGVHRAWHRPSV